MKFRAFGCLFFVALLAAFSFGQGMVVVVDPTVPAKETKLSAADQRLVERYALPKLKAKFESDSCPVELEPAGVVSGAFTKAGAVQKLAFFQVCQTGNGLGIVGLVLIENGKVTGIYASDSGWSIDIGVLPDINQNGIDEFTLSFGGGMHQGQGGTGVDIMEFSGGLPKGLGWFKSEEFTDVDLSNAWKVTAKPGKTPLYYKQKFSAVSENKWRRVGATTPLKLGKAIGTFEVVK